jgi:hypothetical protein
MAEIVELRMWESRMMTVSPNRFPISEQQLSIAF